MVAYFTFKGIASSSLGVVVAEYPPITVPEERIEFKPIPGRSGTLAIVEGEGVYDDLTLAIDCYIQNDARRAEIAAWLRGHGDLVLGNDPTYRYKASAVNQIEMENVIRGRLARTFTAVFRCTPYRYLATPQALTLYEPFPLANPSGIPAEPIITVRGSGNVVLSVGEVSVSLDKLSGSVTIDCEAKLAYVTGAGTPVAITLNDEKWPLLGAGGTRVAWSGGVSLVTVQPNWRWL